MRKITDIIIHEADTPDRKDFHASDIDQWHIERGFKRTEVNGFNTEFKAIGYHYVIPLNGLVETGRSVVEIGAQCQGHNANSIGICLIGKGRYTKPQWDSLKMLVEQLQASFPGATVHGHCEYDTAIAQGKTCPDFSVSDWLLGDMEPLDGHVLVL